MSKKFITLIIFAILIFSIIGYVLFMSYPSFKTPYTRVESNKPIKVTLEFWGIWDTSDNWEEIIRKFESMTYNFNGQKVNVAINYTKKDFDYYEEDIEKAKEKNNMPDIFMINNNWLKKYINSLEPLADNDAYVQEYNLMSYDDLSVIFSAKTLIDAAHEDYLYGMPLYSDSLALYYNKDLLKKAKIDEPPKLWKEFNKDVKKLTILNNKDEIVQAGAAIGTGENINRSSDILSLLIMQGGGGVIDNNGETDINKEIIVNTVNGTEKRTPGKRAIEFYTEFSNPQKEIYSWDSDQENSIKAFADNKAAMIIGYNYYIKNLLAINPDLNYGISQMPQLENSTPINFSNVTIPVVSKFNNCKVDPVELSSKADCAKISWSFLSFAVEKENSRQYLDLTGKVASRKDLIAEQINLNNDISVFASQVESSQSYDKFDDKIDDILINMIDQINLDRKNWEAEVDEAVVKMENLKIKMEN
ncbi:MAG: extracellular solute-binding protein [Candidatus Pacebacteria bacterium]|nr:extracellular solute-binding protein [Candidatus Paceibacterota bacterium]